MDVRLYETRDRSTCLGVFDSLTPELLDSSARPSFESWLDRAAGTYFVLEHEESVVGCGGYALSADQSTATLCWGMVRRSSQKMGLGRFLLMYRIREIGKEGSVGVVFAHSPRPSVGFFLKQGFRVNAREDEAHETGIELIELVKKLTVSVIRCDPAQECGANDLRQYRWLCAAKSIGAFYDEEVHRYLKLTTVQGQVVYHFAIAYPVSDPRVEA